jgi:hypothetical protein
VKQADTLILGDTIYWLGHSATVTLKAHDGTTGEVELTVSLPAGAFDTFRVPATQLLAEPEDITP